jgi:hypothetical protein
VSTIDGLPAHILLVHAVVVLVPLSALLILLVAFWPAARRRLAWPTAILAVVALISVPLTTEAGEWLERRVARTDLVSIHSELGDTMLPWAIALAVVALALLARHVLGARQSVRSEAPGAAPATVHRGSSVQPGGTPATVVIGLLAVVVAVGSVFTVYQIGESGARAAWTGQFSQQAKFGPGNGSPPGNG